MIGTEPSGLCAYPGGWRGPQRDVSGGGEKGPEGCPAEDAVGTLLFLPRASGSFHLQCHQICGVSQGIHTDIALR